MATSLREMDETAVLPPASIPGRWQRRVWVLIGVLVSLTLIDIQIRPWVTNDFDAYHRAAVRVNRGESPYVLDDLGIWHCYRYPPAFAYLMIPLAHLDVAWAGRLWFAGNWLMVGGCLFLALHLVLGPRPWPAGTSTLALISLGACSYYNFANLYQGQVAVAMTLACLGWAVCQRTGWRFSSGLLLAAGCALKLAPMVLVPYLLVRKDWRSLAGLALGSFVIALTPVHWVGVDGTVQLHQDWVRFVKETQFPVQNYRPGNQGLMGMLARLPHVSNGDTCYSDANMATLERTYPLFVAALFVFLYGWILWDRWGRSKRLPAYQEHQRDDLHLSLLFIFMTVTHLCAWRCNFVTLILPCVMLARHVYQRRPGFAISRTVLILVALAWIWAVPLILANLARGWMSAGEDTHFHNIMTGRMPNESWSFGIWLLQGAHFWVAILVGGVCCWISGQSHEASQSAQVASTVSEEVNLFKKAA